MSKIIQHFINGQFSRGTSQEHGRIVNPATAHEIGMVPYANREDAHRTVIAAAEAFPGWAATPSAVRAKVLLKWRQLLEQHQEELANLVSEEHGKSSTEALGSLARGMDVLDFALGIPAHLKGEFSENVGRNVDCFSMRQPLGVCVAITPFNFPAMIPLWIGSVALACGNTVIIKPSERNPSCPTRMVELGHQAGIPKGVLNVLHGAKEAVNSLITHEKVAAVSFVGQTTTAKYVQQTAIQHGKRVQAFGGAKNHALILPDTDIDQTVDAIVGAAYGSAGERCMAISVVVVVGDSLANTLIEKLTPKIKQLKIGSFEDPSAEMGPLITKEHYQKVLSYVDQGIQEGAHLVVDGRDQKFDKGYFLAGCLFDRVQPNMRIYQEEIFGPVLCIVRVDTYEQGLQLINQHPYANGVAIFTRDGDCARDFCSRVAVGMVGVNVPIPVPVGYHSFGGWKQSIFADHGMHGMEGVRFFTQLKTITSRWPSGIRSGIDFSLPTVR
jgi:malonate-semialdehyde dehydrogenase (acetylating) / methylmalonate-semialdehyde dehydrogenase